MIDWLLYQLQHNQFLVGLSGATVLGAVLFVLRRIPLLTWRWVLALFSYEVEVKNNDTAFEWLVLWLSESDYAKRARRLRLSSLHGDTEKPVSSAGAGIVDAHYKYLLSPGRGWHWFMYRNTFVALYRREDDAGKGSDRPKETITLRVFSRDRGVVNAILDGAHQLSNADVKNYLVLYTQHYEGWIRAAKKSRRPLDSVILDGDVVPGIVADLTEFIGAKQWYADRGIPWRRGYLLEGVPGSGKSSLVAALASHLKMGIAVMSISAVNDDRALVSLFREVAPETILLVEDVDAVFRDRQKISDSYVGITFGGFLNAIDGVASADGRILFMTTNRVEQLDPALIRPGRADVRIHFSNATHDQARRIFLRFFPDHALLAERFAVQMSGRTMAELQKHLLAHKHDARAAVARLEAVA